MTMHEQVRGLPRFVDEIPAKREQLLNVLWRRSNNSRRIVDHVMKAKLESLDAKADALRKKEQALTAQDEARRLRRAASEVKSERKNADS